jgi:cytoskeleton protein RodZ
MWTGLVDGHGQEAEAVTLGSELTAARVARGLSIDDVALTTRIRATLIRAIEADDFSQCGGAVYARGHVRSIARAVGLDPEPLLATFDPPDVALAPVALPGGLPGGELREAEAMIARKTRPQVARWGTVMMATVVVILALLVFNVFSHDNGTTPTAARTTTPAATTVTTTIAPPSPSTAAPTTTRPAPTTTPPAPVVTPSASSAIALVPNNGVTVRLNVIGSRSWFHVADSTGKTLFEGILTSGQTKDFTDPKQIRLIVGAPKAVDLVVNGKDIGSLPETGNVGHVVFTPAPAKGAARG